MIHPSLLLLVAIMGFFTKLAIIIGGPLVGKFLDYFPRVPAYNCLNVVQPWFVALILAGAVERLSGVALGVAMEHDWFVQRLLQIAGASLFGIRLSKYGPVTCLKFAAGLMALVITIYVVEAIKLGWKEYMQQPVLPASRAYVLLYFNIVLTPEHDDSIFNAARELSFIGLCAIMSVTATFVSAILIKRLGILKVLSRVGHMSYDVVGAQILQTGIPSSKANLIGTTEVAVASLAESTMLGVAIIANDVSHFRYLAMLSLLSIVGSAFMYCRWMYNPTQEQRTLFSFDPLF
ncbi:hypothetical protein CsatA_008305 [Cannabis sativa]